MSTFKHLFICVAALLISSCGGHVGDAYFPLQNGLTWTYVLTTTYLDEETKEVVTLENLGKKQFDEKSYYVRRSSYGVDYYLNADDSGVHRDAIRTLVELKPRADSNPRFVLKYPLEVGTNWQMITKPIILLRVFPNRHLAEASQVPLYYEIVSTSESVSVPAGDFENCIKVEALGETEIYTDGVNGYTNIPFRVEEWYAPNVGLVKQTRYELDGQQISVAKTPIFAGGRKTLELISY